MKEVVAETTRCQNGTTRACLAVIAFLYLATVGNVVRRFAAARRPVAPPPPALCLHCSLQPSARIFS